MDDQHKYDACRKVLEEALKHIKLSVSLEEKKAYMNGIFSKSIAYYEKIEEYENCVLIKDLQEVLTQII